MNALTRTAAALLAVTAAAVPQAAAQFRYGIRLGGEISTARLSDAPGWDAKRGSGFSGGLTCEYQFGGSGFALDASLLYTRSPLTVGNASGSWKAGDDMLHIPLHAKYKHWLRSTYDLAAPFLYTGPSLMVRLDGDTAGTPCPTRRVQPGWDIGAGFDLLNFIQVSAGYRFGLRDIASSAPPGQDISLRRDGVEVSVTILFDI